MIESTAQGLLVIILGIIGLTGLLCWKINHVDKLPDKDRDLGSVTT